MNSGFELALTLASERLLSVIESRSEAEKDSIIFAELSEKQVSDLAKKILVLPDDDITMLLMRYSFALNGDDLSALIRQEHVNGKIKYIEQLLSSGMALQETARISKDSMCSACKIVLEKYTWYGGVEITPRYSHRFLKQMQELKLVRRHSLIFFKIIQQVAALLIVLGLVFGFTMGTNAAFREKVYHWIVVTFQKSSEFTLSLNKESEDYSFEELLLYKPTFIPDGYKIDSNLNLNPSVYYNVNVKIRYSSSVTCQKKLLFY